MTPTEINRAIADLCRWEPTTDSGWCIGPDGSEIVTPLNYHSSLNAAAEARRTLVVTTADRVAFLNTLRTVIGRREDIPKNKFGVPLVGDYDLLDAVPAEIVEALLRMKKAWVEAGSVGGTQAPHATVGPT